MSTMTGADADELDRAAGELQQTAQRVSRIRTTVRAQVHSAPWHGRSADRFRQQWDSTYTRSMLDAEHFLREATTTLQRNADQQRRASGAGGGALFCAAPLAGSSRASGAHDPKWWDLAELGFLTHDLIDFIRHGAQLGASGPFLMGLSAFIDLTWADDGYGGQLKWLERSLDWVTLGASAVGIGAVVVGIGGALLAGGTVAAGVAAAGPILLGVVAVGGLAMGVDMIIKSSMDIPWARLGDGVRSSWSSVTSAVSGAWDDAASIGRSGYRAVKDSAVEAARTAVEVGRKAKDVGGAIADAGSKITTSIPSVFRSGTRLLPGF